MSPAVTPSHVSVALATFNGEPFIDAQLESLRAQTCPPAELVVTDDGSTDRTVAAVEQFARLASFPVRLFRNPARLGWRGNFLTAAGHCRGDLIAFCDQDDLWYPRKLEILVPLFEDARVLLAYHDADLIDAAGQALGTLRSGETDQPLLAPRTRPTTWSNPLGLTQIFRRRLLDFQHLWPGSVDTHRAGARAAHDQWFYYLASNLGHVAYAPERLLAYRQHGRNAVGFRPARRAISRWAAKPRSDGNYGAMLEAFCRALRQAEADGLASQWPELGAAIRSNERLLERVRHSHQSHHAGSVVRRFRHFTALLQTAAYSRNTEWNLGYRSLLKTALIGVPFGR
jgi:glycosyltransferase involved in cell wall biosynthesis